MLAGGCGQTLVDRQIDMNAPTGQTDVNVPPNAVLGAGPDTSSCLINGQFDIGQAPPLGAAGSQQGQ